MNFRLFTLHPEIFSSFISQSLIGRGVSQSIINFEFVNWREKYGIGNYKQIDDKPFGGGSGMVLMADPIIKAMESYNCAGSENPKIPDVTTEHISLLPNNAKFFDDINSGKLKTKKVNILTTPRGFPFTQQTAEWIVENFDDVNILCGRYEGFDARINDNIDLELSVGNFVLNGGEVGAMCMIEAISRLIPNFITKNSSVLHDSFSSGLNNYSEFAFDNGSQKFREQFENSNHDKTEKMKIAQKNLFDNQNWIKNILPFIEHPQYTRPEIWRNISVPKVLLSGNHSNIQKWRRKWF